ncbi:uncharacterized protein C3orf14 homolog isoform X5 [Kryptolebias marmoratus]|uniref:uncharacterized protein C3orf14 homolog isoform X5 n=1 Tax=Kryptolebias marmoratus TaxID=37003 RepID=UPI0007F9369D|nr:uncharacterized protein C3orf14 homolog isoform X5 [Kryptolebias marmoratus]XP_037831379.1 uncharacterized protein C3orf14 homolog isoform X5 [Kryptolebias marmoratus]
MKYKTESRAAGADDGPQKSADHPERAAAEEEGSCSQQEHFSAAGFTEDRRLHQKKTDAPPKPASYGDTVLGVSGGGAPVLGAVPAW